MLRKKSIKTSLILQKFIAFIRVFSDKTMKPDARLMDCLYRIRQRNGFLDARSSLAGIIPFLCALGLAEIHSIIAKLSMRVLVRAYHGVAEIIPLSLTKV